MRRVRGGEIAMIFQEPMTSLNPVFTIGDQISEAILLHQHVNRKEAWSRSIDALSSVGIPAPERRVKQYPHEMSGGIRQRVMIAMALSCNPKLLVADEPTTALDVTIQAQILELIKELQARTGAALLLITHDLAVVAETVQNVAVMYAGRIVETGSVEDVLLGPDAPVHAGLAQLDPGTPQAGAGAQRDQGRRAQPVPDAAGLQVRAPLPLRLGSVPDGRAGAGGGARPQEPVPLLPADAGGRLPARPIRAGRRWRPSAAWSAEARDGRDDPNHRVRQPACALRSCRTGPHAGGGSAPARGARPQDVLPDLRRVAATPRGERLRGRRREPHDRPWPDLRAGGRVRLRQDDARSDHPAPGESHRRLGHDGRSGPAGNAGPGAQDACGGACSSSSRTRTARSTRGCRSATSSARACWPRPTRRTAGASGPFETSGSVTTWRPSGCGATTPGATPMSSPAASGSASASPARSRWTRISSSATSPFPRSTCRSSRRS